MLNNIPELPVEPPEDYYITCEECGGEIYEGETIYEWDESKWICSDCFDVKVKEMSLEEFAVLLGCNTDVVEKPNRWKGIV